MKKIIFIIITFLFYLNSYSFSDELNCNEFKKFSVNYMKCKANLIKNKTVSVGKNFIDDEVIASLDGDVEQYRVNKKIGEKDLMPDFFC